MEKIYKINIDSLIKDNYIDNTIIKQWQDECLKFWNFFYSLLIVAGYDLQINNLNNIENKNFISDDQKIYNIIVPLEIKDIDQQVLSIFDEKQKFSIGNIDFEIPFLFTAIKLTAIKLNANKNQITITFYCPEVQIEQNNQ